MKGCLIVIVVAILLLVVAFAMESNNWWLNTALPWGAIALCVVGLVLGVMGAGEQYITHEPVQVQEGSKMNGKTILAVLIMVLVIGGGCLGFTALQSAPAVGQILAENQATTQMQVYTEDQIDAVPAEEGTGISGSELITILRDLEGHDERMADKITRVAISGDLSQTTISLVAQGGMVLVIVVMVIGFFGAVLLGLSKIGGRSG